MSTNEMMNTSFQLVSSFKPAGDQAQAIERLVEGIQKGYRYQTLKGVTGSGKTFTMANVIQQVQKPTLILAHNKTLAGQLCAEFREFFPHNAVEYFISYYDYYQPEAYIAATDTYIEKDSAINDEIDRLRHATTASLLQRRDVIIVASVSCIYGLGSPENYNNMLLHLRAGMRLERDFCLSELVRLQYQRKDFDFARGGFRVRGDVVDIFPVGASQTYVRLQFFDDELEAIYEVDKIDHKVLAKRSYLCVYPASHYAAEEDRVKAALNDIELELEEQVKAFKKEDKKIEAYRIEQRTRYDMQMMRETGFTKGIENYSRFLDGRKAGEAPYTLLDFFPEDFLLIVDESHITLPQVGAMFAGDRSRKMSLVEHGFRLPSALDNRPLRFEEFEAKVPQMLMVSATPAVYEKEHQEQEVVQIIRPTGLLDPQIEICAIEGQIEDLQSKIKEVVARNERVIILTLTKRMAEEFTDFLTKEKFKVKYLHSDIASGERLKIIKELREGVFDILVGINLLREGIDLPEVSLIAIMDADKEGFLRSESSLIQMIGRAARNENGKVVLYADQVTKSMFKAIEETNARRALQEAFNQKHGIVPKTIKKNIHQELTTLLAYEDEEDTSALSSLKVEEIPAHESWETTYQAYSLSELKKEIQAVEKEMKKAAKALQFEEAASLRDKLSYLKDYLEEKMSE